MNTLNRQRTSNFAGLGAFFLAATVIAQGCGGDENPAPNPPVIGKGGSSTGGTGGTGNKGGKGGSGGDSGSDSLAGSDATGGTTPNTGGSSTGGTGGSGARGGRGGQGGGSNVGGTGNVPIGGSGDVGNEGGSSATGNEGGTGAVPPDCSLQDPNQCYPCDPEDENNVQFLNHCNDAKCSKFDNAARIEGFTDPLPPL